MQKGSPFGTHRVLAPPGVLPQAAERLDNDVSRIFDNELLIDVDVLNIDSASFVQMESERAARESKEAAVERLVEETVATRGKQHNPVTGSGGMLLGRVKLRGPEFPVEVPVGAELATLVSLTLTPLRLEKILSVDAARHQIKVRGQAILFASGPFALLPSDLPRTMVLSALDVAGAAPQVMRLVRANMRVLVLGCGGKSGLLCAAAARERGAHVVGVEYVESAAAFARRLGACESIVLANASRPLEVFDAVSQNGSADFDLVVSCVNVPDAEMGAILCARQGGTVYFFSMSTVFTKAALGAEGLGRDVNLMIGNGFCRHHADETLALLRRQQTLREIFIERYG